MHRLISHLSLRGPHMWLAPRTVSQRPTSSRIRCNYVTNSSRGISSACTTTNNSNEQHAVLQRVDHVCLVVTDIDRSIRWYSNVLGFEHILQDDPFYGKDPAFLRFPLRASSLTTTDDSSTSEANDSPTGETQSTSSSKTLPAHETTNSQIQGCSENSNESVCLALLPLAKCDRHTRVKNHNGAHVAFRVSKEEFDTSRARLPIVLARQVNAGTSTAVAAIDTHDTTLQVFDYGRQLSLFFSDPDHNILEMTTWIDPHAKTGRL